MAHDLDTEQMSAVDWNRFSIGFGPALKDPKQQEAMKTLHFTQVEMTMMRKVFMRELNAEGDRLVDLPGIKTFAQLLVAWGTWSKERGGP